MTISIDTREFDKKFRDVVRNVIPEAREKGLAKAGMRLLEDAVMDAPTVPIAEGTLRGSGSVFVNSRLTALSPHGKPGEAATSHKDGHTRGNNDVATVGFNTPYAAKLHESEGMKFKEPSAGSKFLSSKLKKNRNRYMKIVADTVQEAGR